jgi:hypothetical protein
MFGLMVLRGREQQGIEGMASMSCQGARSGLRHTAAADQRLWTASVKAYDACKDVPEAQVSRIIRDVDGRCLLVTIYFTKDLLATYFEREKEAGSPLRCIRSIWKANWGS